MAIRVSVINSIKFIAVNLTNCPTELLITPVSNLGKLILAQFSIRLFRHASSLSSPRLRSDNAWWEESWMTEVYGGLNGRVVLNL